MDIKEKRYWYDVLLFVVAVALYVPSLWCGFVGDDVIYFIGNQYIRSFDIRTILASGAIGADYLPLRDLSFALDYLLWGENPFGFHLMNVMLFGITVVIVKHLFTRLNARLTGTHREIAETPAFLAALVFALHPNHREVVYAVFNRGALLTAFFSILSCMLFLKFLSGTGERYRSYAAALLCYVLALLSREYSIILPMVLVLLIFFEERSKRAGQVVYTIPFFLVGTLFFFIYEQYAVAANFITPSSGPFLNESISRLAIAVKIALFYLVRMVTSLGQFIFDDSWAFAFISAVIVAGVLFAAYRVRHKFPHLLFGLLFYLFGLVPVLNFFNTFPVVSPRYSFLPCVGLFFTLLAVSYEGKKKVFLAMCVAFVLTWSLLTIHKTHYWTNNITYWEPMASRDQTPYAYMQLGYAYYDGHQYEQALEALRKVDPVPEEQRYHIVVGSACLKLGDFDCAIRSLETAMALGAK